MVVKTPKAKKNKKKLKRRVIPVPDLFGSLDEMSQGTSPIFHDWPVSAQQVSINVINEGGDLDQSEALPDLSHLYRRKSSFEYELYSGGGFHVGRGNIMKSQLAQNI